MPCAPSVIPPAPNLPSPSSSAAPPPPKISSPPSSPPSNPTPPSAKSPTPSAASSANTRSPSSSDFECGGSPSLFRPPLSSPSPASSPAPKHRLSPHWLCSILPPQKSRTRHETHPRLRLHPPRRNPSRRWFLLHHALFRHRRNSLPWGIRPRPRRAEESVVKEKPAS